MDTEVKPVLAHQLNILDPIDPSKGLDKAEKTLAEAGRSSRPRQGAGPLDEDDGTCYEAARSGPVKRDELQLRHGCIGPQAPVGPAACARSPHRDLAS